MPKKIASFTLPFTFNVTTNGMNETHSLLQLDVLLPPGLPSMCTCGCLCYNASFVEQTMINDTNVVADFCRSKVK